ncbi:MAG TPA: hypothetical protein VFA75_03940 [Nevskia sp.]|nr:hypothetical protein [Nevskia sp.]
MAGATDRWAINGTDLPAKPGQVGQVLMNGMPVVTGYLDDANPDYDERHHLLMLCGRDFTGDLVDCSAVLDGQALLNRRLDQLAEELCKPFGIKVSVPAGGTGPVFPVQAVTGGETIYEVLSRAAAMRGLLPISDGNGGLVFTQAGNGRAKTPLILGRNLIRSRGLNSHKNRFYEYQIVGQGLEHLAVAGSQEILQQCLAKAYDTNIRKSRMTRIVAGDAVTAGEAQILANWVASNRAARGVRAELRVRGWLDGDTPWMPNTEVYVDDRFLRLKGWYLIAQVESLLDEHEEISLITVAPKAAYVPQPVFKFDGISYLQSQAALP